MWRGTCVLLCLSAHCPGPLPSGKAHSTLLRALCQRSLVLGWVGGLCTPQSTSTLALRVSRQLRQQRRRKLSPFLKRHYTFYLGKVRVLGLKKGSLLTLWLSKPDCSSNSTPVASSCANTSDCGKTGTRLYSTSYDSSFWPSSLKNSGSTAASCSSSVYWNLKLLLSPFIMECNIPTVQKVWPSGLQVDKH